MDFASNLRKLRKAKGLTQAQLAKKAGMSNGAIGNYESGKRKNIQYVAVFNIARALEVSPSDLIPIGACPVCGKPIDQ